MTVEKIRDMFPHVSMGKIYFNHAALGPWSTPVLERIKEYSAQRSGEMIENYPYFLKRNESAKEKLGRLLGAQPDRLAWVDNVSNGLNILAQGIDWKPGDRIILNDIEFPSNIYPFLNLKNYGVEIDIVKSQEGRIELPMIEKLITPKTRLLSISLVQFLSGFRADIDEIGELCRNNDIIFCVDSIQAAGVVSIDVSKSKIDFLAGGTQKWLMSSQGLSYIYITEALQERIAQKNVGWTSVENSWDLLDYDLTLKTSADRFQNGTINALGVCVFDAMLDLFLEFGMGNIERMVISNTNYFIDELDKLGIQPILSRVDDKNKAGIVSFRHEKVNQIFELLEKRNTHSSVRLGMLRFSPHFYNTKAEIGIVVDELKNFGV